LRCFGVFEVFSSATSVARCSCCSHCTKPADDQTPSNPTSDEECGCEQCLCNGCILGDDGPSINGISLHAVTLDVLNTETADLVASLSLNRCPSVLCDFHKSSGRSARIALQSMLL
jgi:hypothetical protein